MPDKEHKANSFIDIDSVERIDANRRRKSRRNDANWRRFWTGAELMQNLA